MSKVKKNNLKKMWKEEGYLVDIRNQVNQAGEITELSLAVQNDDGVPLSFSVEWVAMDKLARRQGFRIFPVNQTKGIVLLVSRKKLTIILNRLMSLRRLLQQSYWFIQKDSQVRWFASRSHLLVLQMEFILEGCQRLVKDQNEFATIGKYIVGSYRKFNENVYDLIEDMRMCNLVNEEPILAHMSSLDKYM